MPTSYTVHSYMSAWLLIMIQVRHMLVEPDVIVTVYIQYKQHCLETLLSSFTFLYHCTLNLPVDYVSVITGRGQQKPCIAIQLLNCSWKHYKKGMC